MAVMSPHLVGNVNDVHTGIYCFSLVEDGGGWPGNSFGKPVQDTIQEGAPHVSPLQNTRAECNMGDLRKIPFRRMPHAHSHCEMLELNAIRETHNLDVQGCMPPIHYH